MALLDANGQPIRLADLKTEVATPSLTGVRQLWQDSIARGLTPARLTHVLESAAQGSADDYLTLALEMEERDPHYAAVLAVRKHAVAGLPVKVEAAAESGAPVAQADAVRGLVSRPEFYGLLHDLLDALGKGYAVAEIVWDTRGRQWLPAAYRYRDPRWFMYDTATQAELRLRDNADPVNGLALAPYKFIVHQPQLRAGLAIRGGLARLVAFGWICKAYAMKDWLAYAEVFGMPLRLGRYGPGASAEDVAVLRRAVCSIGSDAAAVLPESMKIEFQKAAEAGGGGDLFQKLCEYLDRQTSKAVLGQTMTTDAQSAGLGSGQAQVQNEVRAELIRSDARLLAETVNRDLVRPFIDLNFGPQAVYPRVSLTLKEPEDLKLDAEVLAKLVPLGLKVGMAEVRDHFGWGDPDAQEELLGAPQATALAHTRRKAAVALNAASAAVDTPEQQTAVLAGTAEPALAELTAAIAAIVEESQSFEELRDKLTAAYPQLPEARLADLIGDALTAAHLAGRYELMIGT